MQSLAHFGTSVRQPHRPVRVNVHQSPRLVQERGRESNAVLGGDHGQPAFLPPVGLVESGNLLDLRRVVGTRFEFVPHALCLVADQSLVEIGLVTFSVEVLLAHHIGRKIARCCNVRDPMLGKHQTLRTPKSTEGRVAAQVSPARVAGDADVGDAVDVVGVEQRPVHDGVGEIERVARVAVHGQVQRNHRAVAVEPHLRPGNISGVSMVSQAGRTAPRHRWSRHRPHPRHSHAHCHHALVLQQDAFLLPCTTPAGSCGRVRERGESVRAPRRCYIACLTTSSDTKWSRLASEPHLVAAKERVASTTAQHVVVTLKDAADGRAGVMGGHRRRQCHKQRPTLFAAKATTHALDATHDPARRDPECLCHVALRLGRVLCRRKHLCLTVFAQRHNNRSVRLKVKVFLATHAKLAIKNAVGRCHTSCHVATFDSLRRTEVRLGCNGVFDRDDGREFFILNHNGTCGLQSNGSRGGDDDANRMPHARHRIRGKHLLIIHDRSGDVGTGHIFCRVEPSYAFHGQCLGCINRANLCMCFATANDNTLEFPSDARHIVQVDGFPRALLFSREMLGACPDALGVLEGIHRVVRRVKVLPTGRQPPCNHATRTRIFRGCPATCSRGKRVLHRGNEPSEETETQRLTILRHTSGHPNIQGHFLLQRCHCSRRRICWDQLGNVGACQRLCCLVCQRHRCRHATKADGRAFHHRLSVHDHPHASIDNGDIIISPPALFESLNVFIGCRIREQD
eukprot:m.1137869 g.1137869  ORF g.1137869 m.1137869 type:complete len:739 (+) comp24437_c1_seq4:668-2884(+)